MQDTTISGSGGNHHTVSAAFWIVAAFWMVAGILAATALGEGLTRLAVVVAIGITDWWLVSEIEERLERTAAGMTRPRLR